MNIAPRSPSEVMHPSVMGASCQTRLSFMRVLLRRLKKEQWRFSRAIWEIDAKGEGVAVYRAEHKDKVYSLAVFARDLPANLRSDRVIASAWDAAFTLFDGEPTAEDIEAMKKQVPLQEAGRNSPRQIVLSRANRSVRAFDAVVNALAESRQPSATDCAAGYLMRTTAVYGNGKFGIADRTRISRRPEFATPFAAEMLAVFMFRAFPTDLVEHLAATRSSQAVSLHPDTRRALGIGNSTGLGMAPFLINHPILLHHWILARETALARVRALPEAHPQMINTFTVAAQSAVKQNGIEKEDAQNIIRLCDKKYFRRQNPWNAVYEEGARRMSIGGRELLVSLLLEPHGETIDELSEDMACDESFFLRGDMTTGEMRAYMTEHYQWAMETDFSMPQQNARFWYVSREKLEPRLGERKTEPGARRELPMTMMRDAQIFMNALAAAKDDIPLAVFLARHPEHRRIARRVQIAANFPYSEIHANLVASDLVPANLLRCKLAFFGANGFDPRSDRWLRINMFQHAPYPDELHLIPADNWAWNNPS